jgi:CubicO group peptidase (beta-lactamase class C family)
MSVSGVKRSLFHLVTCLFALSFFSTGLVADDLSANKPSALELKSLEKELASFLAQYHIPGGLIAVASEGELIHIVVQGMANVELGVPIKAGTVFEIGSISKQFTSAAIMMLVAENQFSLEDKASSLLPNLPSQWVSVTIRQLLNHTSGIPDYEEIASYDIYADRLTLQDIIDIAHSRPMDFEPGQSWHYSNTAYYLLSLIVEKIEALPFAQVLANRIFKPLDMAHTRMASPSAIIANRASGYWIDKNNHLINRPATEPSSTLGAGGLVSTAADLAKWDMALKQNTLLSDDTKRQLWTKTMLPDNRKIHYGFGWELYPYKGNQSMGHTGQVAGFLSSFDRFPDSNLAFILFLNLYDVSTEIKYAAFDKFLPIPQ